MQMHKWKAHFATHLEVSYMLMQMEEVLKKGTTITNLGLTFILLRLDT